MLILALLFAALMSLPYLVPNLGMLALVGFVPLLFMDTISDTRGVRHFWCWHYLAFVLWNACTTFWIYNATIGGAVFAILANSLQMSLIFGIYRFGKRFFGNFVSYLFLAVMWIAWERFYFSAEISWPWLTLGNAFARSIKDIQWYEFTGTLGGSLWVWICNILTFMILLFLLSGHWREMRFFKKFSLTLGLVVVLAAPICYSRYLFSTYQEVGEPMDVVIAQPDFDPYEKFQSVGRADQDTILLGLFDKGLKGMENHTGRVLLLAPETFTDNIVVDSYSSSTSWNAFHSFLQKYPYATILFGASSYRYFRSETAPSPTSRKLRDDIWVQSYNSALTVDRSGNTEIYHKCKLVVGVEKTPYPKFFTKIDDKLGGVMGRCIGQSEISNLHVGNVAIGPVICYESVYGEYCTGYVRRGAEALAIITNDAWWGDTPGYEQHLSYASLRAIETRRDIARCANTGISGFINQKGECVQRTQWWKREVISGHINLNNSQTFYVRFGDLTGRVCTVVFLILLLIFAVKLFLRR